MDFSLSEEQQLFRESTRRFLREQCHSKTLRELESSDTGFSGALWNDMAAQGWTGIIVPEELEGEGGGWAEAAVVVEGHGEVRGAFLRDRAGLSTRLRDREARLDAEDDAGRTGRRDGARVW